MLVSYPKSGRTWVRFMLLTYLRLLSGEPGEHFMNDEESYFQRFGIRIGHAGAKFNYPYYAMPLEHLKTLTTDCCLLLVRNVYETLNSSYYEVVYRQPQIGFNGSLEAFVRDPRFGPVKLATFFNVWTNEVVPRSNRAESMTYADLRADTIGGFAQILEWFSIPLEMNHVEAAVESGRFDKMLAASLDERCETPRLRPRDRHDARTFKIRRADPAEAATAFTPETRRFVQQTMESVLVPQAYRWIEPCIAEETPCVASVTREL